MEKVAVVIPFYHYELTKYEQISLQQCLKVLGKYPIVLIVPDGMNKKFYPSGKEIVYERVPDAWLKNVGTYNTMMLSEEFYRRFLCYEYILIYQLDAFVFYDRLEDFCNMDYDYIGAPWLYGVPCYLDRKHCTWYVGNGGLSLRKVSSCIKLLKERKDMLTDGGMNEDLFFAAGKSDMFAVAPVEAALRFSFEQEIEKCYCENGGELPFGCHAWERYHFAFWRPYIEQFGYELGLQEGDSGEDDRKLAGYYEERRAYSEYMKNKYSEEGLSVFLKSIFGKTCVSVSVWGAGFYGRELCAMLKDAGMKVDCILDNNCEKQNRTMYHCKVLSLDAYREKRKKSPIIISVKKHCKEVADQLEECGYKYGKEYIFYRDIWRVIG